MNYSPFSNKRRIAIAASALLAILLVGGAVMLSKRSHADASDKKAPAELQFTASDLTYVTPRALAARLEITGNLEARSEATVRAKEALDVKEILVREGDVVHAGQVLAQLDTAQLAARLAQKISTRDSAKAQFEMAEKNRTTNHELLEKKFISQFRQHLQGQPCHARGRVSRSRRGAHRSQPGHGGRADLRHHRQALYQGRRENLGRRPAVFDR
jgi:multidrug efflux pump subunit AcrA (membrane-fusion protein)